MHSSDFKYREKIEGKTQREWEDNLGMVGIINHLNDLGWKTYQWRYQDTLVDDKKREEYMERYGDRINNLTHFAEFFSPYYNGYLRGDSKSSLREAMENCLNEAQGYLNCENNAGHSFVPYKRKGKEYDNGLIECSKCGFNGYTSLVGILEAERDQCKKLIDMLNTDRATFLRNAHEAGVKFNIMGEVIVE